MKRSSFFAFAAVILLGGLFSFSCFVTDDTMVSFTADAKKQHIKMYWKDASGARYASLGNLKKAVEKSGKKLLFASNAGMYKKDHSPQGLYIENGKQLSPIDTSNASGNFYLKPNGVFYLTKNKAAGIVTSEKLNPENVAFATQSGPMLLIDGQLHEAFKQGSSNVNIRNGVGVLPDGKLLFAMSKKEINFYDFASYFKKAGCKNALYLDGFVSRAFVPEANWKQLDGDFGVIIGITN